MAIRMEIYDGVTPIIDFIAQRSYGFARQALTETGMDVKDKIQSSINHYHTDWWHGRKSQIPKDAKNVVKMQNGRYIWREIGHSHALGMMVNHSTGEPMNRNIIDSLSSYISPEGGLSVTIGGSHKAATIKKYKDGVVDGDYGVLKARSAKTKAIFHKLNTGEINEDHPYYKKGRDKYEGRLSPYIKNRNFFEMGRIWATPTVVNKMNKYYQKLLPQIANNAKIQTKIINTRSA